MNIFVRGALKSRRWRFQSA